MSSLREKKHLKNQHDAFSAFQYKHDTWNRPPIELNFTKGSNYLDNKLYLWCYSYWYNRNCTNLFIASPDNWHKSIQFPHLVFLYRHSNFFADRPSKILGPKSEKYMWQFFWQLLLNNELRGQLASFFQLLRVITFKR